jgi:hypothetical protein
MEAAYSKNRLVPQFRSTIFNAMQSLRQFYAAGLSAQNFQKLPLGPGHLEIQRPE